LRDVEGHTTPIGTFRESRPPKIFSNYKALMNNIIDSEPSCFEEATSQQVWKDAMMEEYQSIMKNEAWDIVSRPKGKSIVISKWIYKIKHTAYGSVEKYKARFVAREFSRKKGVYCEDTFAPVARYTSIRTVISPASIMKWKIHQMDVKTTFLNDVIEEEEVYIEQPQGFEVHERKNHVCRLKVLYGLMQTPRAWYLRIDGYLQILGFKKSDTDPNLYLLQVAKDPLILVLYVDDLFLTRDENLITRCKRELASELKMKDIGLMHYFLGLEVWKQLGEIFLRHGKYAIEILKIFGMMECKSMTTPMTTNLNTLGASDFDLVDLTMYKNLIGSLMYLVNTRPDIYFSVNTLSQFLVELRHVHWVATNHVLR
jgi:hypothetical protein